MVVTQRVDRSPHLGAERANGARERGFRPAARSRVRIAAGTLLSLVAIGAILIVFSTVDKRVPVLQLVRDVPAGAQIADGDLRVLEVSADASLATVAAADRALVVGSFAKVRLIAGSLLTGPALQSAPLVSPGRSVVAVTVPAGEVPSGMRERSRVRVVIPADPGTEGAPALAPEGRLVGLPGSPDSITGAMSVSIELDEDDAVQVASATRVRLVLRDPGVDEASEP